MEDPQDWATYIQYFSLIVLEFDADGDPENTDLIKFSRKDLKSLFKA